ncbi:MAG: class III poly(R)-hydroxyalkanoic acid synthase subunit PhaE [Sedimenticolaceae bacterium]
MSTNANNWNESLMNDWMATQRKYWETWSDFARQAGGNGAGDTLGATMNPFAAFGNFTANPMMQNPFAKNPFMSSNPFSPNPFAQFTAGANPLNSAVEQWWSSIQPQLQGDVGTVAQRFYDMGKNFMSMAEGLFGAAGQEQPEAAMSMWMNSMHTVLEQWINQIQNNMDLATPDLPGVSGTALSSWAQLADSIAPWLNMSQHFLKEVAEGHLPGGIEMPGVGAAQEQFLRALSIPGLGYTREQQDRMQNLARHLLTYHDAFRAYKLAFAKTALASLDWARKRLGAMHERGEKIESLRGLYDLWVDASEEAYAEFAMSDEYQVVYGDLVNSLMQVRKDLNELAEHQYELMHIPTRSEIDTMQHRQQENRREARLLRHEIALLREQVEKLSAQPPAASSARARTRAKAPAQNRLQIDDVEEDLTAIRGIGPKMMEKLYAQGIKNFARLAQINKRFAEELDETLNAQGRLLRDDWVGQAKKLRG